MGQLDVSRVECAYKALSGGDSKQLPGPLGSQYHKSAQSREHMAMIMIVTNTVSLKGSLAPLNEISLDIKCMHSTLSYVIHESCPYDANSLQLSVTHFVKSTLIFVSSGTSLVWSTDTKNFLYAQSIAIKRV